MNQKLFDVAHGPVWSWVSIICDVTICDNTTPVHTGLGRDDHCTPAGCCDQMWCSRDVLLGADVIRPTVRCIAGRRRSSQLQSVHGATVLTTCPIVLRPPVSNVCVQYNCTATAQWPSVHTSNITNSQFVSNSLAEQTWTTSTEIFSCNKSEIFLYFIICIEHWNPLWMILIKKFLSDFEARNDNVSISIFYKIFAYANPCNCTWSKNLLMSLVIMKQFLSTKLNAWPWHKNRHELIKLKCVKIFLPPCVRHIIGEHLGISNIWTWWQLLWCSPNVHPKCKDQNLQFLKITHCT